MLSVKIIEVRASNYTQESKLRDKFLTQLNNVLLAGGKILSVTIDEQRVKRAYVEIKEEV